MKVLLISCAVLAHCTTLSAAILTYQVTGKIQDNQEPPMGTLTPGTPFTATFSFDTAAPPLPNTTFPAYFTPLPAGDFTLLAGALTLQAHYGTSVTYVGQNIEILSYVTLNGDGWSFTPDPTFPVPAGVTPTHRLAIYIAVNEFPAYEQLGSLDLDQVRHFTFDLWPRQGSFTFPGGTYYSGPAVQRYTGFGVETFVLLPEPSTGLSARIALVALAGFAFRLKASRSKLSANLGGGKS